MTMNNQSDESLDLDGLKEVMTFDPFGPSSNSGDEGDDGQGASHEDSTTGANGEDTLEGAGDQNAQSGQAPAAGDQPPAQAPSGGVDKDKTIESLRAQIANMLTTPQAPQAPKPGEQPQGAQPQAAQPQGGGQGQGQGAQPQGRPTDPYNIQVTDQLIEGIASDDPRQQKAAISALASSIMNQLYRDFSQALDVVRQEMMTQVPLVVQQRQTIQSEQARIEKDFYDAFPELNKPALRDAVWTTVGRLAQAEGLKEWTPEFRDNAGNILLASFGIPKGQAPAQTQQDEPKPAANGRQPRKTFAAGSGGPANRSGANEQTNEFADVLHVSGF